MFYPEHDLSNENDAILIRSFRNTGSSNCDVKYFGKPIRTDRMNRFFYINGFNCPPNQEHDR